MYSKQVQRLLAILLVLVICVLPMMVSAQGDLIDPNQEIQQEVTYQTDTVRRGTFTKETTFSASEYYPCNWSIACPVKDAAFVEYTVNLGAQVKAGDVLVRLSTGKDSITLAQKERELSRMQEEFAAAISEKEEAITAAKAAADIQTDAFEKEQMLISVSIMETELKQFCYLQQRALDAKQQEVEDLRSSQQTLELTAPSDGTITALTSKEPEETVAAGEVLLTMARTDIRLLQVKDPAAELRCNMQVSIVMGRGNNQKTFTGRVIAAEDILAPEQRSGYAYVLPSPGTENMVFREVRIAATTVSLDNVLLVNRRAVNMENANTYVTKLNSGVLQRRGILLGFTNPTDAWIMAGVTEGDVLILN